MNKTNMLIAKDKKYLWHPFTQMADWQKDDPSSPVVIEKAKGNYLYDTDGNRYLDGVSSLWVTLHGHNHGGINAAIEKQLHSVAHTTFLGLTHEPAITLAERLLRIAPRGLSRVFYSDNGSTAVEVALKMAYQYWKQKEQNSKKERFLSLQNAYHGDTIGSVSVGGMGMFHAIFRKLLFKSYFTASPYCYRCVHRKHPMGGGQRKGFQQHCRGMGCWGECIKETEAILKKHHTRIAAAVVEPLVQGAAGMLVMPKGYMKAFERLCRKYNVLLICDEVATGFGRTGKMFACEHEGIVPDFLCVAKGITGGYLPLAATLSTENVYRAFLGKYEEFKAFFHGHTYTANPLACAAALANLAIFNKERTLEKLQKKMVYLNKQLERLRPIRVVGDIRQLGLMAGIELVRDRQQGFDFPVRDKVGAHLCAALRTDGVLLRPLGNVIVIMPPLSITITEIDKLINALEKRLLRL